MECNKDEAKRAMDIAERKVTEKDYTGAKKFANKAQALYPHLDGLKQLLMAVDVYISVRKQYRKLALMLHPDKNKCKGAEGAFKLVSEAWGLLSDKVKRYSYNLKRQVKGGQQRFPTTQSAQPASSNGFQNAREHDPPAYAPPFQESSTFWTMCSRCKTQYEFQRVYLNQTLLCPHCRQGFFAAEKNPPPSVPKPTNNNHSSNQQKRSSKVPATNKNSSYGTSSARGPASSVNNGFSWEPLSRKGGSSDSRNAVNQAANVVQQAQEKLKRAYEESQERDAARGFTNSDLENYKRMKTDGSHGFTTPPCNPETLGSRRPQVEGILLPSDMKKALVKKAQSDISKRLMAEAAEEMKAMEIEKKKSMKATSKADEVVKSTSTEPVKEVSNDEGNGIVVPDSDFHNFDLDRTETAFQDDEIWAAYDEDDGMPRYYARIQKVVSLVPFRMRISWLNTKTCKEFAPVDWVGFGFAKSCGDFRTSKYELTDALNAFSHKVDFTKGAKGLLHIFPKKGQVWALYRHWSPDWDGDTPDEVKHKYDMVEVLDYYTEDKQSLTVAPLLKAEGFKLVFRRSTDQNSLRKIPKEEMFRFSHQVPHYILTGKEADNAPEGCVELDPAATPCELLEVKESSKMDTERSKPVKEKSTAPEEEEMGMNID
ncbi:BnaA10g06500D [Brassica napus]|uniref:BnaA10g06500D protein n=1 Tax=Brassica napus TaxID=3708 RepID=A0A078IEX9_BRANA|nr:BnaA10g06500D [Brassica napus]